MTVSAASGAVAGTSMTRFPSALLMESGFPVASKVADFYQDERAAHHVDGITAATITGKGVTALLDRWINIYEPFFSKLRKS